MKRYFLLLMVIFMTSCIKDPEMEKNTYEGNFKALWKIIDTRYCYLDSKQIDWNAVYNRYDARLHTIHDERALFDLLAEMLAELKDGHVNLYSDFDVSRYWDWYTDYPSNFNSGILYSEKYLGKSYKIAGGLRYGKIHNETIGYIYYGSFSNSFTNANIHHVFDYFKDCKALIIDVRDNGGGSVVDAERLASYFFTTTTVTGYIAHKTGPGHSDFSKLTPFTSVPHSSLRWDRKVAVLTNRMSYSATNDFVNRMKNAPKAIIVGDKTGGGGGMPLSSELPNGWSVRFSACPMFDIHKIDTEGGIDPDEKIDMDTENNQEDLIIETAIDLLLR